jgi:hypothetical protein
MREERDLIFREMSMVHRFFRREFLLAGDADLIDSTIENMPAQMRSGVRELATQAFRDYATLIHGTATPPRSIESHR